MPTSLKEIHYKSMAQQLERMERLGVLQRRLKSEAAIPGYGGFIPAKESSNICGATWGASNTLASEITKKNSAEAGRVLSDARNMYKTS